MHFELGVARQKQAAQRARRLASVLIEGEYVTSTDIAARLGISDSVARSRLAKVKKQPGAVTWAKLQVP